MRHRTALRRCAIATAIAVAVVAVIRPLRCRVATARARIAANDPSRLQARIAMPDGMVRVVARMFPTQTPLDAADALVTMTPDADGDDTQRMSALAALLSGDGAKAVTRLESIRNKTSSDWVDLSAAEILRGDAGEDRWISALIAADRALSIEPGRSDATYNKALVLDHFGLTRIDGDAWPTNDDSRWMAVATRSAARARAATTPRQTKTIETAPDDRLNLLARQWPSDARAVGETVFLAAWAEATTPDEAEFHLGRARRIGETLSRAHGETFVADAVSAIDHAGRQLESLRSAYLIFREGRLTLDAKDDDETTAVRMFSEARRRFRTADSPMAALSEEYLATAYLKQARTNEAFDILMDLDTFVRRHPGYKSLKGRIQHDLALCEAQRGHWSASVEHGVEAMAVWRSLRDLMQEGAAIAIVAEAHDFLGQREVALSLGVRALRDACTVQHLRNARAALSVLTKTEMRAGRWEAADALARLESEVGHREKKLRLDVGLLIRIATIKSHRGEIAAARNSIEEARSATSTIKNPNVRIKLLADVDGAAGAILRERDPPRAAELLSSAIAYQKSAARALFLPELYLERGRASLALREWDKAERDFESGIAELERQRDHVDDAEARPGLFDSSAALFEEATALQVRRRADPARVLATIERGRARAMLEQLGAAAQQASLKDVQRGLADGAMWIEYFALPERLVIVAVTRRDARVVAVDVTRDALAKADRARLYDILIRPVLRDERAITVVVDDALQRVPFTALVDRSTNEFLVWRHTVAMAPSAGVALIVMQREQTQRPQSALVLANPEIPRDKYPNLRSLKSSEKEAEAVARWYEHAEVFKRDEATAERFLALAPQYDSVHFAGHANVEKAEPGASALVCASSARVHGALTLRQIAAMRFTKTRVVVLAACSTMDGRNAAIEGVPSLARAFVIAGVPAVVGTLWDIDDAKAAPIMRVLHEELAKGTEPADALRAAQLAAIREGRPVKEWAAFAVTGVAR